MAAGDGLISMKPTSIDHVGTSAVINDDGGVDFTAVTSLSLDGVFTSDYDNYLIVITGAASSDKTIYFRVRASGSDASGTEYTVQTLAAYSNTKTGERRSSQTFGEVGTFRGGGLKGASEVHVYGPGLPQATAWRAVTIEEGSAASILDRACTHSLSTAYDGFTILSSSAVTFTGNIHVFGYEE